MVEVTALIWIEVSGTKSFSRVGVPSQPQPDNSNSSNKPDLIKVTMRVLEEKGLIIVNGMLEQSPR
jgi:hypothetical protein